MNGRLFLWSLTSALAGFLFGFDTVVISGAEQTIQSLWNLGNAQHGLAMGMALWGTVLGAMLGGWPTDKFGRKNTLLWIGILYFVSAVGSGLAPGVNTFMIARFIGGLGIGVSTVAAPLYISEIAPAQYRGRLTGMFQFNIVFGILVAFLSNFLLGKYLPEGTAWRWMLGVEAFPALLYTVLCFGIPKSPRWLIAYQGDREAGVKVLRMLRKEATQSDLEAKADEIAYTARDEASTGGFWSWRLRFPILLAFLIAFFNQLSGINAVLYFAPRIFELTGLGTEAALLNSVGIGVTNLLFTFVGLYLIDRLGRRTLLYVGSVGYIVSLGLCAWAFFTYAPPFKVANAAISLSSTITKLEAAKARAVPIEKDIAVLEAAFAAGKVSLVDAAGSEKYPGETVTLAEDETTESALEIAAAALKDAAKYAGSGGLIVLICIFAFIASHAIGQGAVIWVFISEIFPAKHRGDGQALGSFTHWIFAALITTVFPAAISAFAPGYVFLFFSFMMVLQLIWVKVMVPETKGISLEQMQHTLKIE